jgi:hypothetical protein
VLAPGFYAQQNIRTPVKIAIFTWSARQLFNLAWSARWLMPGWPWRSAGACLNAGLLFWKLRSSRCSAATGLGLFLPAGGGGGADVGSAAGGHALHAGLGSGHMLERFLRLGGWSWRVWWRISAACTCAVSACGISLARPCTRASAGQASVFRIPHIAHGAACHRRRVWL